LISTVLQDEGESPAKPDRVLLVDDSPLVRDFVGGLISDWGFQVATRETGKAALQALETASFDVVIADIDMPEMSGLDLLTTLRVRGNHIPIIMLSSASRMSDVLRAIHQGAFDYVAKDEAIEPLRAAIQRALEHIHLVRQNQALTNTLERLNGELEDRVRQRTRDLETVNNRLIAERGELEEAINRLNETQEQLVQMEKMASIGMLTAGIAHEINNPLAFILPNFELLEEWVECERTGIQHETIRSPVDVLPLVSECRRGLDRIVRIIRQLRIFSHPSQQDLGPVDLAAVVRSVFALVERELDGRSRLSLVTEAEARVRANEDQLRQVLLNLIINSAQSLPPDRLDGRIDLSLQRRGQEVGLRVQDNGCGIPAENLRRVFDPFFTTKPVGKGTGMGLAITRDLITKMGGNIQIESHVGKGTVVTLTLPVWREPAEEHRPVPVEFPRTPTPELVSGLESARLSVVLVEDEMSLLVPLRRMLATEHDVLAFSDALDGMRCLTERVPPDVIICDIHMPNVNGLELYKRVTSVRPHLADRFIFLTGGSSDDLAALEDEAPRRVLQKPVQRVDLLAAIRAVGALKK
jgi:signal transduction histidine kinase